MGKIWGNPSRNPHPNMATNPKGSSQPTSIRAHIFILALVRILWDLVCNCRGSVAGALGWILWRWGAQNVCTKRISALAATWQMVWPYAGPTRPHPTTYPARTQRTTKRLELIGSWVYCRSFRYSIWLSSIRNALGVYCSS